MRLIKIPNMKNENKLCRLKPPTSKRMTTKEFIESIGLKPKDVTKELAGTTTIISSNKPSQSSMRNK